MNIVLLIFFILFFIQIILSILIYNDSKNRGMNPILWTAIVILTPNLFGLVLYLAFRFQYPKLVKREDIIKEVNANNNFKRKHKLCPTCGRELEGFEEKCPYCNSLITSDDSDDEYFKENIKRKRVISIIALFTVVIMISFSIIALTPFKVLTGNKVLEILTSDFFQTNKRIETNNLLSNKYTYWDGKDEKTIEIHKKGFLIIDYELESKEGILYSVIKNSDNKIIKTLPGNTKEKYKIEVNNDERYTIIVVGQNTKGFYKFEWYVN